MRRELATALVLAHLVVVGYSAARLRLLGEGALAALVDRYAGFSGANTQYGFFAPNVGTQFRAFFDVEERGGTTTETLEKAATGEVDIRMSNVVALFGTANGNEHLQRALAASWAGKILGRHPTASAVRVRIEAYALPSLADYRAGRLPEWREIYRARFSPGSGA